MDKTTVYHVTALRTRDGKRVGVAAGFNVKFRPYERLSTARQVKSSWQNSRGYHQKHYTDFRIEKSVTTWEVVE